MNSLSIDVREIFVFLCLNIFDCDLSGSASMTDRREFLTGTGALALAATIPAFADERPSLPTRLIPGTDESMAIIGLGNSNAFRQGDVATSEKLLDIFLWHGGTYIDVSGSSRETVGRIIHSRGAQDSTILGNYLEANDSAGLRSEIAGLQEVQGAGPLDLALRSCIESRS
jgi:hypothetical protein